MGHIYLVRHGQASFGSANYDQLSELGFEQARLLGQWFANCRQSFQRVVNGGMTRHRQTADACLAELPRAALADTEWLTDDGFAEFDHHEVLLRHCPEFADAAAFQRLLVERGRDSTPGQAFEQVFRSAMQRWMSGWHDDDYTETWPVFRHRCVAALERLNNEQAADAAPGRRSTIVFTSGGTIATLMQHVLGLQDFQVMDLSWTIANCAITKLQHRRGQISVSYLNNYAHLEWLGEAGAVTYR
jgi:broad specificity phosphatase PhoE